MGVVWVWEGEGSGWLCGALVKDRVKANPSPCTPVRVAASVCKVKILWTSLLTSLCCALIDVAFVRMGDQGTIFWLLTSFFGYLALLGKCRSEVTTTSDDDKTSDKQHRHRNSSILGLGSKRPLQPRALPYTAEPLPRPPCQFFKTPTTGGVRPYLGLKVCFRRR